MTSEHAFHPSIIREYDIRGIVGKTLFAKDAFAIGQALANYLSEIEGKSERQVSIAVGYDGRLSSPELEEALVQGLVAMGAKVHRVGRGPTPMLYFAVHHLHLDGGVMVTGSHNPKDHNGFKIMAGKRALYGEELKLMTGFAANKKSCSESGNAVQHSVFDAYVKTLLKSYQKPNMKSLKIAWDAGNGAAGEVMSAITKPMGGQHILMYEVIDGNFPNHHPDPTKPENLADLRKAVSRHSCDLGIAFDGDADRIVVVDDLGRGVQGEQLMVLFSREVLAKHPGAKIIFDVKASDIVGEAIAAMGGKPMMWKTGHSLIKAKMAETDALFAAEMTGHIFFKDQYYGFDDGLYAAIRLINILQASDRKLSELVDALPKTCASEEMRIDCEDERKFDVVKEVKARMLEKGIDFNDIDGIRVKYRSGWWLLRASNTQGALVARCEAKSEETLAELLKDLKEQLILSGVEYKISGH